MKTIKLLVCAVLLSSAMIGCGSRSAQNGEAENTNAVEKTEEEIANAVPKPIELGPNDILEFGEPQPMPIVVDFSASWCGPCRQMHPIFDKLAKKYHGKVQFIYVDIDKAPQLAKQYGVEAVPTLLFVNKKGEIDGNIGFMSEDAMEEAVQSIIPTDTAPRIEPR